MNDLENMPYFLVAAFLYILTEPSLLVARVLLFGYVASRLLHFGAYLTARTHDTRATLWTIGSLIARVHHRTNVAGRAGDLSDLVRATDRVVRLGLAVSTRSGRVRPRGGRDAHGVRPGARYLPATFELAFATFEPDVVPPMSNRPCRPAKTNELNVVSLRFTPTPPAVWWRKTLASTPMTGPSATADEVRKSRPTRKRAAWKPSE